MIRPLIENTVLVLGGIGVAIAILPAAWSVADGFERIAKWVTK